MTLQSLKGCAANTDRELWREVEGDYYANSIHVTKQGAISINVGGTVLVKPLREWHALAMTRTIPEAPGAQDMGELARKVACGLRQITQSMATDALAAHRAVGDWQDRINGFAAELEATPTPSGGDVESLIERLRGWQGAMPDALKDDLAKAADKLAAITSHDTAILLRRYRRAIELMPDEIEVFRLMRRAGRGRAVQARAVAARIESIRDAALKEGSEKL